MLPKTSFRSYLFDITGLTCAILIFYLLWLGSYPLFTPDEGRYVEAAREMVTTGNYITPHVNGVIFLDKPILYYWLQALALTLFGKTEWAARLFPVLFALLGGLSTYLCGRQLFNRETGMLSALILVSSPLYFASAHYANLDLEIGVLISCTLLFFITAIQSKDKSRRICYFFSSYLFAALAFLTKGMIGIVFPIMVIGSWVIWLRRWDILKQSYLVSGVLFIISLNLPWFTLVQKANPAFFDYFFVTQQVSRFLSTSTFNNPMPVWFYVPIVLIGFFPWSAFIFQAVYKYAKDQHTKQHQTMLFLLLWIALILIFFSIPHSKIMTYILPVFPALALIVGRYFTSQWNNATQRGITFGRLSLMVIGTLLISVLLALVQFNWPDFSPPFLMHLSAIAFFISIAVWASFLLRKKTVLLPVFISYMICTLFSLLALVHGAKYLNHLSAKSLAINLKTIMQPDDEIVNYFKFYYDVPFYLEKRITIVANWHAASLSSRDNWLRELSLGKTFQHTENWLIDEPTFWQRWNSNKRLFVFINANHFNQFKFKAKKYYLIGTSYKIFLVSNKPDFYSR